MQFPQKCFLMAHRSVVQFGNQILASVGDVNLDRAPVQTVVHPRNQRFYFQPIQQSRDGGAIHADIIGNLRRGFGQLMVQHVKNHPLRPGDILFLQLLLGAWVAGLDAGYVSNTWPLMNDRLVPAGIEQSKGAIYALTHDPFLIHFLHRWWAWVAVLFLVLLARRVRHRDRAASIAIHTAFGTQILLGIATVMSSMNIVMAVLHQAVGALLVAATAWGIHVVGRREP